MIRKTVGTLTISVPAGMRAFRRILEKALLQRRYKGRAREASGDGPAFGA
jgi:hypothetical protein